MSKYKGPANHTSAFMVPRFLRKTTAQATINAVTAVAPDKFSPEEIVGCAAYIWYQRSNGRKSRYCHWSSDAQCIAAYETYQATGVFPVSLAAIKRIKPSTIARYAELARA